MLIDYEKSQAIHDAEVDGARQEERELMAVKFLKRGLSIEEVSEVSGISIEELQQLLEKDDHLQST